MVPARSAIFIRCFIATMISAIASPARADTIDAPNCVLTHRRRNPRPSFVRAQFVFLLTPACSYWGLFRCSSLALQSCTDFVDRC